MHTLRKVDSIMYRVSNLHHAVQFYQKMLGMKLVWLDTEREMAGLVFAESDTEIVIHTDTTLPNPDFSFLVDDVAAFCQAYSEAGGAILVEPFDVRCGKYAIVGDADQNQLAIIDLTFFGGKAHYDTLEGGV